LAPQDFQDSNPYSRNLILISLSIILFILADGQIQMDSSSNDEYIKLHVLNIKFNNVEVFKYFIWSIFFWFNFRFWQLKKDTISEILLKESLNHKYSNCCISRMYTNYRFFKDIDKKDNTNMIYKNDCWQIYILRENRSANTEGYKKFEGISDFLFLSYIKLKVTIFDSRVLSNYMPYIISICTVYLAVVTYY